MTPTIFGSTVGYPSDSLASCCLYQHVIHVDMKENVSGFFFSELSVNIAIKLFHQPTFYCLIAFCQFIINEYVVLRYCDNN